MKKYFLLSLLLLSFCRVSVAEYKAVDGDSLIRGDERIRLKGVDAPELYQKCRAENNNYYSCGEEAYDFLQNLMAKGNVYCKCQKQRDRYKRKLCECFVSNLSLNREMISAGYAVAYKSKKYEELEAEAKKHKYGLWRGKFMRPAIYRALQRANNPNYGKQRKP